MCVTSESGQNLLTSDQTIHNKVTTEDCPEINNSELL